MNNNKTSVIYSFLNSPFPFNNNLVFPTKRGFPWELTVISLGNLSAENLHYRNRVQFNVDCVFFIFCQIARIISQRNRKCEIRFAI